MYIYIHTQLSSLVYHTHTSSILNHTDKHTHFSKNDENESLTRNLTIQTNITLIYMLILLYFERMHKANWLMSFLSTFACSVAPKGADVVVGDRRNRATKQFT